MDNVHCTWQRLEEAYQQVTEIKSKLVVELLVKKGAELNVVTKGGIKSTNNTSGDTPIHLASKSGHGPVHCNSL